MDFLGIGWMEVLVVLVVALIAFGPERLPEIARNLGKTVREVRESVNEATRTLTEEEPEDVRRTREVLTAQRQGQGPSGVTPATPPDSPAPPAGLPVSPSASQPAPPHHGEPEPPPTTT